MPAYKFAQLAAIAECKGYVRPIAMQNLYNLIQREQEKEMIPLCRELGVGLIPYSPLARGVLAGNRTKSGAGDTERSKNDRGLKTGDSLFRPSDTKVVNAVVNTAARFDVKPTQVALAWLLSKAVMAAPIIGVTKLEHIDDAVAALDLRLSKNEMERLEEHYQFRCA